VPSLIVLAVFSSCCVIVACLALVGSVLNVLAAVLNVGGASTGGLPPDLAGDLSTLVTAGHIGMAATLFTIAAAMGALGGIGHALRAHIRRHWHERG
jgi:hypothetical protein